MPTLTMDFEAGTTGEVEFVCPYFRFDSVGNEISAPFSEVADIVLDSVVVTLPSGVDPDVTPNPWSYTVLIRIDGIREFKLYVTMPMTDANFVDIAQLEAPAVPEYFVLKSDFLNHLDAVDNPVSQGDVDAAIDDAISAHEAAANPHPVYLTQAEADLLYLDLAALDAEEAARIAADSALDARLDTEEATSATLTAGLAAEVLARIADVDAEQARAEAAESTNATAITTEASRAVTAEGVLNAAIVAEAAARGVDVDAEESRALTAEALLAPKASPVFTGNPQAPTPTGGDNDTSIATTAFVQAAITTAVTAAIDALVDGAPGALDTLNELAAALNDDAAFSATVTAALAAKVDKATLTTDGDILTRVAGSMARITRAGLAGDAAFTGVYETIANVALKAPLASPALTGTPTAPTQAAGNNSTRIATTAYADGAVATEAANRVTDVDAEETRALAAEALLAPKASPALTGTPTAPTAAQGTNTTQIATTAMVQSEVTLLAPKASPALTGTPTVPTAAQGTNTTQAASTAYVQTEAGLLIPKSLVTTKGDIITRSSTVPVRKGVGANDTFLTADSAQTDGLNYRVLAHTDLPVLPMCTVTNVAQTLTDDTLTTLVTTGVESVDTHGFHSDVTNRSRMTIPSGLGGRYVVITRGNWQAPLGTTGYRRINYVVSGSGPDNGSYTMYILFPVNGVVLVCASMHTVRLDAGDFITMEGRQTSGGNLTFTLTEWTIVRIAGS